MSLWYDPDTDTVVKDAEQTGDEPPSSKGVFEGETALDWRGNGEYDPGTSVPATPFDESPDESERPKSRGPAARYDEIALDQLSKTGFTGKDLGDAGIRITHHLGAEQGLTAKELLDTLAGMSDDEIRGMVDKAMRDLTTTDREGNEKFDFARDYMQELYAPRPDSSNLYGLPEKPPSAPTLPWGLYYETPGQGLPPVSSYSAFSPAPPTPTSFTAIRHDPDLLERYYRALDVHQNALGHGMTDEERTKLADDIASGALWEPLDEMREKQSKGAAEFYSPKAPQAEDYAIRHPGYAPALPLSKTGYQVYDSSAGGLTQTGRLPLFQVIDKIKARKGSAKDAFQHILDQTYGTTENLPAIDALVGHLGHSNFGGIGSSKGDTGFLPEMQDDKWYRGYWGKQTPESTQLGHFLTAVDFGLDGGDWLKSAMIRHEQIPDTGGLGAVKDAFTTSASPEDMAAFDWAIVYDMNGDYKARDEQLRSILEKPDLKQWQTREGNSLEDLVLSVRGWELGRQIALGVIKTNEELADWIAQNVASGYN